MLWHLPILRAIGDRQGGPISLMTKSSSQADQLFPNQTFISSFLWLETLGLKDLINHLKTFDTVWVLHHSWRYPWAAYLARVPQRFGYGVGWPTIFLNQGRFLPKQENTCSKLEKWQKYAALNDLTFTKESWFLKSTDRSNQDISRRYHHIPKPWVSLGIGASMKDRCWAPEYFSHLADKISTVSSATLFLCGAPYEHELAEKIKKGSQGKNIVNATSIGLKNTVALLSQSQAFVGNDSGLLNLAACLGIPAYGLFKTEDIFQYVENIYPLDPISTLSPDQVFEAVSRTLQKKTSKEFFGKRDFP